MAAELVLLQAERLRYALPNSTTRRCSTTAWLPRLKLIRHTMWHFTSTAPGLQHGSADYCRPARLVLP